MMDISGALKLLVEYIVRPSSEVTANREEAWKDTDAMRRFVLLLLLILRMRLTLLQIVCCHVHFDAQTRARPTL